MATICVRGGVSPHSSNKATSVRLPTTYNTAHYNIKGEVFRYLVDLEPGNIITLFADGRPYTNTVESRFVAKDKGEPEEVRRENARWIGPFPNEWVTLITCWPYTNNTHRVIVIAKPTG
jgi:sortase A